MRHLHQYARAVTGVFLAAASAAVIEILQDRQGLLDDFVRFYAFDVDDEPDAASIMLETRIIQTLLWGQTGFTHASTLLLVRVFSSSATKKSYRYVAAQLRDV